MFLDALAKMRQFVLYTFFHTGSAAEFKWPYIIQVIARQYGEEFSDEQINTIEWVTKNNYLKRNPDTAARKIGYAF